MTKFSDHWCDQLDKILGVNSITKGDFLHWGSAKWKHVLEKKPTPGIQKNRWIEQPLFYNPTILNARRIKLRPNEYNIPDTRVVSKLKLIDISRKFKIMPMRDLIT